MGVKELINGCIYLFSGLKVFISVLTIIFLNIIILLFLSPDIILELQISRKRADCLGEKCVQLMT